MKNTQKFKNFLESLKGNGQDSLINVIQKGFTSCYESLEHTVGDYYYDASAGKYYNKGTDMYVEPEEVTNILDAGQKSNRMNNNMLGLLLKAGLINGNEYQKMHSHSQWPEKIMGRVHTDAKQKGIDIMELWKLAKVDA